MKFKTPKSEKEIEMEKLLSNAETTIDDSELTTKEARKIMDMGYVLLIAFKRIRESRDTWRNKLELMERESSPNLNKTNRRENGNR